MSAPRGRRATGAAGLATRAAIALLRAAGPAGVAVLAALALAGCGAGPEVVARDRAGDRVAAAALPPSGRFALAYRHSYFRAAAEERFRALGAGGFALEAIASPHAGVLDYYELAGPRRREGGAWVLRPERPPRFHRLAVAGTPAGRRTLVAGAARRPLWGRHGAVRHVEIAVEGR